MMHYWPQIAWIAINLLSLGVTLANHGKTTKTHFGWSLVGASIVGTLLYFGGFFSG